jgi:hypothetical protein
VACLIRYGRGLAALPASLYWLGQQAVNAENPVLRFEPNTVFTYSEGWTLANVNRGWINNDGFVNDQEYKRAGPRPLLAIIGDCFIEARMMPSENTLQGRLAATVGTRGRVYTFAAADAGLNQYLIWATYAAANYKPDAIAININAYNFEESLTKYGIIPGRYQFSETIDGRLELRRSNFTPNPLRTIKKHSALLQYLDENLRTAITVALHKGAECPPNSCASPDAQRLADAQKVLTIFLDQLANRAGLPPERILLIVDSVRPKFTRTKLPGRRATLVL